MVRKCQKILIKRGNFFFTLSKISINPKKNLKINKKFQNWLESVKISEVAKKSQNC